MTDILKPPAGRPWILAHRGHHRRHRENTLAAIRAAHRVGADGVEVDVRLARGGHPVLYHDGTRRVRGLRRALRNISRARLPRWVPGLAAAARWLRSIPDVLLDLEVKDADAVGAVLGRMRHGFAGRLVLTSFDLEVCRQLARRGRHPTGWIHERPSSAEVSRAARAGCRVLVVHRRGLIDRVARAARRRRLQLWVWGVNSAPDARRAVAFGAGAIITDRPDRLVPALRAGAGPPGTSPRTGRRGS